MRRGRFLSLGEIMSLVEPARGKPVAEADDSAASNRWPRILYVDDDPNIVASMERHFHRYRVSLVCAYHGMQGIWLAATEKPDLIITDLTMPMASGEELIDCLASHPATQGTPILVLTGNQAARLTAGLRHNGVVGVFHKPLKAQELIEAVGRHIPLVDRN